MKDLPSNSSLGADEPGRRHDDLADFERVDWEHLDTSRSWLTPERTALVVGLLVLLVVFINHRLDGGAILVHRWIVGWTDWLLLVSLVVGIAYGIVPLARQPSRLSRIGQRLRGRWGTILSLVVFVTVVVVGGWALVSGYRALIPWETGIHRAQPPMIAECVSLASEQGSESVCNGIWPYPLGTDTSGYKLTELLVMGARPVVYATLITLGLIVPIATVVGVVAGYYGGLLDDLLMAYVDIQISFPALLVYLIIYMFVLNSLIVFFVAFGLLSWGGIARIVRSETLQRREEGYILAARSVGAPPGYVMRHHLVPNVTNSAIPAAFHLIAIIILTEAGLSFLGFHPIDQSWGHTIQRGFTRAHPIFHWWIAAFPAIALAITVIACKLLGDGLRDVLDPRGGR